MDGLCKLGGGVTYTRLGGHPNVVGGSADFVHPYRFGGVRLDCPNWERGNCLYAERVFHGPAIGAFTLPDLDQ